MNSTELKQLRHGDEVTDDRKRTIKVGISPSAPKKLHFWHKGLEIRKIDTDSISMTDFQFINRLTKV